MGGELVTNYQAVYKAWQTFQKGKNPSRAIDMFVYCLEQNIEQLSDDLCGKTYQHGAYQQVVVHEKKRRNLAVAAVLDRVVHRLLYDYLVNIYDKCFDFDVWSCRKDKGLHKCLRRTQLFLKKYPESYIWRADIAKFFDHVDHEKLLQCLRCKLQPNDDALWLCQSVISSYAINRTEQNRTEQNRTEQNRTEQNRTEQNRTEQNRTGIPIGNLTSQIFSNIYLNEFDRFVRHHLKPQVYLRYGDDFLLFCKTRKQARELRAQAETFLSNELGLSLNPKNHIIVCSCDGLKFLGHDVTADKAIVDKYTTKRVLERLNSQNVASYKALGLDDSAKEQIDWILLESLLDLEP